MKCVVIEPDGSCRIEHPNDLEDLQKLVGGYIEGITLDHLASGYVNEEGKLLGKPMNLKATQHWWQAHGVTPETARDFIVGPMIVCGVPDEDGNDTDISEEWEALLCP